MEKSGKDINVWTGKKEMKREKKDEDVKEIIPVELQRDFPLAYKWNEM
jgi:hypothetical protein